MMYGHWKVHVAIFYFPKLYNRCPLTFKNHIVKKVCADVKGFNNIARFQFSVFNLSICNEFESKMVLFPPQLKGKVMGISFHL